jgi:hypothetical protein
MSQMLRFHVLTAAIMNMAVFCVVAAVCTALQLGRQPSLSPLTFLHVVWYMVIDILHGFTIFVIRATAPAQAVIFQMARHPSVFHCTER